MASLNEAITSQISDSVRKLLRQVLGQEDSASGTANASDPLVRQSKGLREFWGSLRTPEGMQILDLGEASQSNVNFITGLGHRVCTEDLFRPLRLGSERKPLSNAATVEESEEDRFFRDNFKYAEGQLSGVLCWDVFDLLPDTLVKPLVERLHRVLKPGGHLLTFFHTGQPGQVVPVCQYKICAEDKLEVSERGSGKLRRSFNNRGIESLFRDFSSLKFYLTKDSLREVVIVR